LLLDFNLILRSSQVFPKIGCLSVANGATLFQKPPEISVAEPRHFDTVPVPVHVPTSYFPSNGSGSVSGSGFLHILR
jgi:hypothetical protein